MTKCLHSRGRRRRLNTFELVMRMQKLHAHGMHCRWYCKERGYTHGEAPSNLFSREMEEGVLIDGLLCECWNPWRPLSKIGPIAKDS